MLIQKRGRELLVAVFGDCLPWFPYLLKEVLNLEASKDLSSPTFL